MENEELIEEELTGAEAETVAPEEVAGEAQEPQAEESEEQKRSSGIEKRMRELTRKAKEADEEREFWRKQALQNKPIELVEEKPVVVDAPQKPKADDFEDHEQFVEALTDWKFDVRDKEREQKAKQQSLEAEKNQQYQQFTQRRDSYKSTIAPDFDEVLEAAKNEPVSAAMQHFIGTDEHGPAFLYFIAKNPTEAQRLAKLDFINFGREISKLETRFVTAPGSRPVKTNVIPEPITPVTGRTAPSSAPKDDDDFATWEAKRKAQLSKR